MGRCAAMIAQGTGRRLPSWSVRHVALVLAMLMTTMLAAGPAAALQPISVSKDDERIEITALGELYSGRGDTLQVETAAGADGAVGRMSVRAVTPGTNPNWLVFALTNTSDKPLERWLTADRYNLVGSGAVWPDLDAKRVEGVTPSFGFVPERIESDRADVFRLTLEPGQTITYVAELSSERFARVYLWQPIDYELKVRDRLLFNGVLLGLTALLAVFLTAIFAANHKLVFPASALVAWCALVYLCVDFGFFHKLFHMKPQDNAVYRAAAESGLAASLLIFLHVFLRLALWNGLVRMLIGVWMLVQLALIAISVIDPRLAATFARLSFLLIGGIGGGLTFYLAVRGQDRALSLIPTWILFLVWIFASAMVLTGRLSGDMVLSSLVAGMVLILLLIGFTVTQFAFRSIEPTYGAAPSEMQLRSIAVESAGAATWEWSNRRDEVKVGPEIEAALGLAQGELSVKSDEFLRHLHPQDREKFRVMLWSMQERTDGRLRADLRMRHADNSYRWFEIEAARVQGSDPRSIRCIGLIRDVTDQRRAHERLVNNAVHCNLTGLPNRAILMDRLGVLIQRAKSEPGLRPQVLYIGLDKFRHTNASFGLVVGDSLLLTVARRLQRHMGAADTLARTGGDQFALLIAQEQDPAELLALAERVRRSLRSPVKIAGEDIVLTASVGIGAYSPATASAEQLVKEAEIAMLRAKRSGADRAEVFKPEMKGDLDEKKLVEADLRRALEKGQIKVFYLPIVSLSTEELAGFQAIARWDHPKLGLVDPTEVEPDDEASDLAAKIAGAVLMKVARDAAQWQTTLPRADALFATVSVGGSRFFRHDVLQEVKHVLGRNVVPKGILRLAVDECLVMENPEQSSEMLDSLKGAGAGLVLDSFGSGMSSFAYLNRLPFELIRIDPRVVRECGAKDSQGLAIVRSAVALGHELGKRILIDGVETAEEAAELRSAGCEFGAGVYFGNAHTEGEAISLLKLIRKTERKIQPRALFPSKKKKNGSSTEAGGEGLEAVLSEGAVEGQVVAAPGNGSDDKASRPKKVKRRRGAEATETAGASDGPSSTRPPPPAFAQATEPLAAQMNTGHTEAPGNGSGLAPLPPSPLLGGPLHNGEPPIPAPQIERTMPPPLPPPAPPMPPMPAMPSMPGMASPAASLPQRASGPFRLEPLSALDEEDFSIDTSKDADPLPAFLSAPPAKPPQSPPPGMYPPEPSATGAPMQPMAAAPSGVPFAVPPMTPFPDAAQMSSGSAGPVAGPPLMSDAVPMVPGGGGAQMSPMAPPPMPHSMPPVQPVMAPPLPDLAGLPPSIAASLARLAGKPLPPAPPVPPPPIPTGGEPNRS